MNDRLKNEKGLALVSVLVVSTVLALVSSSYLSTSNYEAGLVTQRVQDTQGVYCAETGIGYAKNQLKTSSNWTDTSWTGNVDTVIGSNILAGNTAIIGFTYDSGTNIGTITSTCGQQEIVASVSKISTPPYNESVCGCEEVELSNNTITNSYDSSGAAYDAGAITQNGDVASNGGINIQKATVNGSVLAMEALAAHQNCTITGDASVTLASYLDSDLTDEGADPNVQGDIIIDAGLSLPCDCSAIDVSTLVTNAAYTNNNADANVSPYLSGTPATVFSMPNNAEVTLNAGTYYFTSLSMGNGATITIAEGAQVVIFVNGSMTISNGASLNSSDNVSNLKIYSNSTADINFGQNSSLSGTIYAPAAEVEVDNNAHIYGAILAKEVEMINNAGLHYDTSIPGQGEPVPTSSGVRVQMNSWIQN